MSNPTNNQLAEHDPSARKTCACGNDRSHYMVSAQGSYTLWGWVCHTVGISVSPSKLTYRCRICGNTFDETTDPTVLRGHI